MAQVFSKEEMMTKVATDATKSVYFNHPAHGEKCVKIRRITSLSENSDLNTQVEQLRSLRTRGAPELKKYSDDAIGFAPYLAACVVEPQMTTDDWLEFSENVGLVLAHIYNEIFKFSGMSAAAFDEEEARLEKDTFQDDGTGGVS